MNRNIFDLQTELEIKEHELGIFTKLSDELKRQLDDEKQVNEDLVEQNDVSLNIA